MTKIGLPSYGTNDLRNISLETTSTFMFVAMFSLSLNHVFV